MGCKMTNNESLPKLLTEQEAAEILNVKVSTLRRWRWSGGKIGFVKIGEAVRYHPRIIEEYIARRARTSTSDSDNHAD